MPGRNFKNYWQISGQHSQASPEEQQQHQEKDFAWALRLSIHFILIDKSSMFVETMVGVVGLTMKSA